MSTATPGLYEIGGIEFDRRELRDLAIAWVALGIAFTFFLQPPIDQRTGLIPWEALGRMFGLSMVTVGTGFLLHELAHKVVAIRFGQIAAFRADYGMLGLAIASGLAGFLFAAPGAVYHRGPITTRQNGIVAVAGPLTNIGLAAVFLVVWLPAGGFLAELARMGIIVNVFLAAFNMIPFGPLDGKTVIQWSKGVFLAVFVPTLLVGAWLLIALL